MDYRQRDRHLLDPSAPYPRVQGFIHTSETAARSRCILLTTCAFLLCIHSLSATLLHNTAATTKADGAHMRTSQRGTKTRALQPTVSVYVADKTCS
jgi:hypothetical protein